MGFWIAAAFWLGSFVIGQLWKRMQRPGDLTGGPAGISQFDLPTATEARPIPIVFGTCLVKSANVLWYGDLSSRALGEGGQTTAWRYFLGIHYGICMGPVDSLRQIYFDEKRPGTFWSDGYPPTSEFPIDGPAPVQISIMDQDLYGAWDQEGGPLGHINFYFGTDDQPGDPYLELKMGTARPTYAGLCHAVFGGFIDLPQSQWRGFGIGNSPNLWPVAFEVRRCPNQLDVGWFHELNGDANPACILYEIMTDVRWGLGISPALIDVDAFRAAAETIALEEMPLGMSFIVESQMSASDLLEEALRHIDGTIFADPVSGVITIALARDDYDPDDLVVLDESCITSLEFSRPSWEDLRNVIRVRYVDRYSMFTEKVVQERNLGSIQATGERSVEEIDFRGCSRQYQALFAARRASRVLSYPLARLTIVANRRAQSLRPASVFKLTWPELGISGMVCRVTRDGSGTLTEGRQTIEAVEDVFAIALTNYTVPPPSL